MFAPLFLSLSLSVVASKGRQNRFPKFPRGPPMAACIDSQRCDYTRTPSSLFTDSFRSTRIRHAFSTRPLYSVPFRPFPSSPISENNGHCPLFLPLRFWWKFVRRNDWLPLLSFSVEGNVRSFSLVGLDGGQMVSGMGQYAWWSL